MEPAHQRLEADHRLAVDRELRLVVHVERALGQGAGQLHLDLAAAAHLDFHVRLEQPEGAAPVALGAVDRNVGKADQLVGGEAMVGRDGGADRGADDQRVAGDHGRPADALQDRGAERRDLAVIGADRDQHHELVAAEAGGKAVGSHHGVHAPADLGEQQVAEMVAQRVVDVLEAVEIDEEQREAVPRSDVPELLAEHAHQHGAVGEAAERIDISQARGERLALGEILRGTARVPQHDGRGGKQQAGGADQRRQQRLQEPAARILRQPGQPGRRHLRIGKGDGDLHPLVAVQLLGDARLGEMQLADEIAEEVLLEEQHRDGDRRHAARRDDPAEIRGDADGADQSRPPVDPQIGGAEDRLDRILHRLGLLAARRGGGALGARGVGALHAANQRHDGLRVERRLVGRHQRAIDRGIAELVVEHDEGAVMVLGVVQPAAEILVHPFDVEEIGGAQHRFVPVREAGQIALQRGGAALERFRDHLRPALARGGIDALGRHQRKGAHRRDRRHDDERDGDDHAVAGTGAAALSDCGSPARPARCATARRCPVAPARPDVRSAADAGPHTQRSLDHGESGSI